MNIDLPKDKTAYHKNNTGEVSNRILKQLSLKKRIHFYEEIGGLIEAGVDLSTALQLMEEGRKGPDKSWITNLRSGVIQGKSLAEALKDSRLFSLFEIESIKASELAGKLASVLKSNLDHFKYTQRLNKTIRSAVSYPIFLLVVATGVVVFMLRVVVPMFSDVYKQMNKEMPGITIMLLNASTWLEEYGVFILMFILLAVIVLVVAWKKEKSRIRIERLLLQLPIVGRFYKNKLKTQQIGLLKTLTEAYVPIYPALQLTAKSSNSYFMKAELISCAKRIEGGEKLATVFEGLSIYQPAELLMIKLGEETNALANTFDKISMNASSTLEEDAKLLGKTLEPALIGLVTIFIGVILVALYLPLFSMSA